MMKMDTMKLKDIEVRLIPSDERLTAEQLRKAYLEMAVTCFDAALRLRCQSDGTFVTVPVEDYSATVCVQIAGIKDMSTDGSTLFLEGYVTQDANVTATEARRVGQVGNLMDGSALQCGVYVSLVYDDAAHSGYLVSCDMRDREQTLFVPEWAYACVMDRPVKRVKVSPVKLADLMRYAAVSGDEDAEPTATSGDDDQPEPGAPRPAPQQPSQGGKGGVSVTDFLDGSGAEPPKRKGPSLNAFVSG